jgi:hypothetical protein
MKLFDEHIGMRPGLKRPVALIDVDHTLVYTDNQGRTVINMELIRALKAKGIHDLYLFTDMIFRLNMLTDRIQLINDLQILGFTVHGCITPNDYFWGSDPKMLEKFDNTLGMANVVLREGSEKNPEKIPGILAEFSEIKARVESENYPDVCMAYAEVSNLTSKSLQNQDFMNQLGMRSQACKTAIDLISREKHFKSAKGIMLRQFLAHLPAWVSECFVFDDNSGNIEAVNEVIVFLKQFNPPKDITFKEHLVKSPPWISNCFVFDKNGGNTAGFNDSDPTRLALHAIHGEFTHKRGDTFVANLTASTAVNKRSLRKQPPPSTTSKSTVNPLHASAGNLSALRASGSISIKNLWGSSKKKTASNEEPVDLDIVKTTARPRSHSVGQTQPPKQTNTTPEDSRSDSPDFK